MNGRYPKNDRDVSRTLYHKGPLVLHRWQEWIKEWKNCIHWPWWVVQGGEEEKELQTLTLTQGWIVNFSQFFPEMPHLPQWWKTWMKWVGKSKRPLLQW